MLHLLLLLALSYRNSSVLYYNFLYFMPRLLLLHLLHYYLLLISYMSYHLLSSIQLALLFSHFMLTSMLMFHLYMPLVLYYMLALSYLLSMSLHSSIHYIFLNYLSPLLSNNMFIALTHLLVSNLYLLMFHLLLLFNMYYYYISGSRNLRMLNIMLYFTLSMTMLVSLHSSYNYSLDYSMLVPLVLLHLFMLSVLTLHNLHFILHLLL